jgi:hypothetical protein
VKYFASCHAVTPLQRWLKSITSVYFGSFQPTGLNERSLCVRLLFSHVLRIPAISDVSAYFLPVKHPTVQRLTC